LAWECMNKSCPPPLRQLWPRNGALRPTDSSRPDTVCLGFLAAQPSDSSMTERPRARSFFASRCNSRRFRSCSCSQATCSVSKKRRLSPLPLSLRCGAMAVLVFFRLGRPRLLVLSHPWISSCRPRRLQIMLSFVVGWSIPVCSSLQFLFVDQLDPVQLR
jgi:hypothetical protein